MRFQLSTIALLLMCSVSGCEHNRGVEYTISDSSITPAVVKKSGGHSRPSTPTTVRDGIGDIECNRRRFSHPSGDGLVISAYAPTRVDGRLCKIKVTLPDSLRDEWEVVGGTGDRESVMYVGPLRSDGAVNTEGADGIFYIDDFGNREWGRMHIFLRSNKGRAGNCDERTMIARRTRFEVSGIDDHADRKNTRRKLEIGMMNAAMITTLGGAQ